MRNCVKMLSMMLLAVSMGCLAACSEPTDAELLVGHWTLEGATETVSRTPGGTEVNDLPGFEGQTMDLYADNVCCRVDRGDSTLCRWFLAEGRQLLFSNGETVTEDYQIDDLTDERLALSHAYIYHDSLADTRVQCLYQYEYTKTKN